MRRHRVLSIALGLALLAALDAPRASAGVTIDGLDNDGDGLVDFPADPDCSLASDDLVFCP